MINNHGPLQFSLIAVIVAATASSCCGADGERRCGARSLQIVLGCYGIDAPLSQLEDGLPRQGDDSTFAELAEFATTEFGLFSSAVRWTGAPFPNAPPAIIPVAGNQGRLHFVAVVRWDDGKAIVQNDTYLRPMSESDLRVHGWDGTALHFARNQVVLDDMVSGAAFPHRLARGAAAFFVLASLVVVFPRKFFPRKFFRLATRSFSRSARETKR